MCLKTRRSLKQENKAHYYDPHWGRFFSADTFIPDPSNPQSFNRYSYVLNNPLMLVDPSGHRSCTDVEATQDYETCSQNYGNTTYSFDPFANAFPFLFLRRLNQAIRGEITLEIAYELAVEDTMTQLVNYYNQTPLGEVGRWIGSRAQNSPDFLGRPSDLLNDVMAGVLAGGLMDQAALMLLNGQLQGSTVVGITNSMLYGNPFPDGGCSFSADTLVMFEQGLVPIAELEAGERVWAFNEDTGEMGYYPIQDIWVHLDSLLVYLTIAGETIKTTPDHPFRQADGTWTPAQNLRIGDEVQRADGNIGNIEAIWFTTQPQFMYNLTVTTAHTYFIGTGQWLVHNDCYGDYSGSLQDLRRLTNREVRENGLHSYKQQLHGVRGNYDLHVDMNTGDIYVLAPKSNFYNWVDNIPSLIRR